MKLKEMWKAEQARRRAGKIRVALASLLVFAVTAGLAYAGAIDSNGNGATSPATGGGDTCTGGGCAIGPAGISTDGGIIVTGPATQQMTLGSNLGLGSRGAANVLDGVYYNSPVQSIGFYNQNGAAHLSLQLGSGNSSCSGVFSAAGFTTTGAISSTIAGGSVAYQSLTGAKTCLGTGATTCLTSTASGVTTDTHLKVGGTLWGTTNIAIGSGGGTVISGTTPTIGSGFGTSPSVVTGYGGAFAFVVDVGTGGTASSGVITMPTITTGWACMCNTITTHSATVFACKQTATTTTSVTIGNFDATGAAAAWVASNKVSLICVGY